jgi:site-specific DNA-methyltransferase (adenine-specific)
MKKRAPRNRTLSCSEEEINHYTGSLRTLTAPVDQVSVMNQVIHQDTEVALQFLPDSFVDLVVLDPPYNLTKNYNGSLFRQKESENYGSWFEDILLKVIRLMKPDATIYVCSDWRTSTIIFPYLNAHLKVRNRITWEREKGRGAKSNWKNNTEDIWYCTKSDDFTFNVDAVKLKRRVIAPYRSKDGNPKDWQETRNGNFRLTHPSNIWSDITIPFWSMPENTDHPTQKPEKLIAKMILASSSEGHVVFDPFLGSGTTAVVSRKLKRRFCGIERELEYCSWSLKRLDLANSDKTIQGYADGVFWERNSLPEQKLRPKNETPSLFAGLENSLE